MLVRELYARPAARLAVYVDDIGRCPTIDFIDELPESEKKKLIRLFQRTCEIGIPNNREKFRKEKGEIYAFKSFQVRVLCFYLPGQSRRTLVLTHALKKKADELKASELDRAAEIRKKVLTAKEE